MHLAAVISMSNPRLDLPSLLCHQSMSTVPPLSPCSIHFSFSPPFPSFCLHFGSNVYDFPSWLCPSAAEGPTPARKKTQGPTQKHTQSDPKPHLPSSHTTTAPHDDWWLWFNELLDELLWRLMFRLSMMMMKSTHYIWSQRMNLFHFGHSHNPSKTRALMSMMSCGYSWSQEDISHPLIFNFASIQLYY